MFTFRHSINFGCYFAYSFFGERNNKSHNLFVKLWKSQHKAHENWTFAHHKCKSNNFLSE